MDFEKEAREAYQIFRGGHEIGMPPHWDNLTERERFAYTAVARLSFTAGQENMRARADLMCKVDANSWEQNGEHEKAYACRVSGKNIRFIPLDKDPEVSEFAPLATTKDIGLE